MKIVFDTNVLFAAFVSRRGLCSRLVEHALLEHHIFVSEFILAELTKHLKGKAKLDEALVDRAIASLIDAMTIVTPTPLSPSVVRDPDDVAILGTATASNADALVSGDKDLLTLVSFRSIPILSPRQFYDRLNLPSP